MKQCPRTQKGASVHTLANGMTVALERLPHLRSATAGLWIRTGSANETEAQAGISHFLEHLFFKGTAFRTARQLVEAVENRGGQLNAFTSRDSTCIYAKTLDAHVATGVEILADIVKNSTFADLEKERQVVLEEIASIEDVPEDFVHDLMTQRLWPSHPLGRPVTGSCETLAALGLDDVRAYYASRYTPGNMVFAAAGNFDEQQMLDQVRAEFETLPPRDTSDTENVPEWGSGLDLTERNIAQNHLCCGFPGPAVTDPDRYVYDVLTNVLGGGSTSRLFERIREEAGLAYAIYAFHASYRYSGMVGVYAAVAPHNLPQVLDLTCRELRDLRDNPITELELENNREQLKGGLLMALEGTFSRMARMARSLMYYNRLVPVDEIVAAIDAVTAEDIRRVASDIFDANRCVVTLLGPTNGRAPLGLQL